MTQRVLACGVALWLLCSSVTTAQTQTTFEWDDDPSYATLTRAEVEAPQGIEGLVNCSLAGRTRCIASLNRQTAQTVRVRLVSASGTGAWSSSVSVPAVTGPPPPPTGTAPGAFVVTFARAQTTTPPPTGGATVVSFNGASSLGASVNLGTGAISWAGWVKLTAVNGYETVFHYGTASADEIYIGVSGARRLVFYYDSNGIETGPVLTIGTWYYLAYTRSSTRANSKVYVNGSPVITLASAVRAVGNAVRFGASPKSAGQGLDGQLGPQYLYRAELTAAQIATLAQRVTPSVTAGLAAWYALSGDATDRSGNGVNLTAVGAPSFVAAPLAGSGSPPWPALPE